MESFNNKGIHWAICLECYGYGKIAREPSKRRRRLYQEALDTFKNSDGGGVAPKPLHKNMDVCPHCAGSGLLHSQSVTAVDSNYPHVAIIGGGIGGTAFAVACLHRGIPFTLYERDQSFDARSQGYGLTLQQASKAIKGLGILQLNGAITSPRHVVHNPEGKIFGEWGLRKWNKPHAENSNKRKNVHIARQTLRSALFEQLHNHQSVKWGYELIGFAENKKGSIDLTFQVGDKKETAVADLIVGADGIRSSVRKQLIAEEETPLQYLGCIVILGICSLKSLAESNSPLLDSATVFQTVNGHERVYVMPYDKDTIMWQLSFPVTETEAKALSREGAEAMKAEAQKRLPWHDPIPQMLTATPESLITGYPVYDRLLFNPSLLSEAGNATLIGDAAHPMSPFKGQGANQALLDALALARTISVECGPSSNWRDTGLRETILKNFEQEMAARTASKVRGSAEAARLLHSNAVMHEGDEPRGRGLTTNL